MAPPVPFAVADFFVAFPEFANASQAQIAFWEAQAYEQLSADRFGKSLDLAAMLFVAHYVTLSAQAVAASTNAPATVGAVAGPVSSKSVGGVSKSMDIGAVTSAGGSQWNTTSYGIRLLEMMKRFSMGGAFVRGPSADPSRLPLYPYGLGGFGGLGGW